MAAAVHGCHRARRPWGPPPPAPLAVAKGEQPEPEAVPGRLPLTSFFLFGQHLCLSEC